MNAHYDKYLTKRYPRLYKMRHANMQETCMCWGFDCGDGWFSIINALSFALENLCDYYNIDITVAQVKEKYGTLRFYWSGEFPENNKRTDWKRGYKLADELVDLAEISTYHTCEICGRWASKQTKGWIITLCDKHYLEELKRRRAYK